MRSLFISDIHLGCKHSKTEELLTFLKTIKDSDLPEKIFLVGDIIDGWRLKRNWFWDSNCTKVIRMLMTFSKKGVQIIYIAGNHDEFLRAFLPEIEDKFFGFKFVDSYIHETKEGEKVLVIHGDQFDATIKHAKWICVLGDIGYSFLLSINGYLDWIWRKCFRCRKRWSLSKAAKANVKSAISFIAKFEELLTRHAAKEGCSSVICGHIHTPDIKDINGVKYLNTGDWVESCSAITENDDGKFELVHFE